MPDVGEPDHDHNIGDGDLDFLDFRNGRGTAVNAGSEQYVPDIARMDPLEELRTANAAVVATLTEVTSRYDGDSLPENIVSDYIFMHREVLKGTAPNSFTMRGGVVSDEVLVEYSTPVFAVGEEYLLLFYVGDTSPSVVRLVKDDMVVTPAAMLPIQFFRDISH